MDRVRGKWGMFAILALLASNPASVSGQSAVPGAKGADDDYSPDRIYPGERVLLVAQGGQMVPCAATDTGWAELIRIRGAADAAEDELAELRRSGQLYEVNSGTWGIVLESSHLVPGLKLADGAHAGQVCFTDRVFVQRVRQERRRYWLR